MLLIGAILLVAGIGLIVVGVNKQIKANEQYDAAHDKWHNAWWAGDADLNDQPDMPGAPVLAIVGGFVGMIGLVPLILGARPFFIKVGAKMTKETLDYAGDDISAVGEKVVDVAKPVVNKGAEVLTPIVGNMAESISSGINKGKAKLICPNCKKKIDEDSAFCPKCGYKIEYEN